MAQQKAKRGKTQGKTLKKRMEKINKRLQKCAAYLVVEHKEYDF